jgi:hypothetical protein
MTNELRLEILSLRSLCRRQDRADLIQMFRITHQLFAGYMDEFLEFALEQRLRGHSYKTQKESFKDAIRQFFLTKLTFMHSLLKLSMYLWTEINLHLRLKLTRNEMTLTTTFFLFDCTIGDKILWSSKSVD